MSQCPDVFVTEDFRLRDDDFYYPSFSNRYIDEMLKKFKGCDENGDEYLEPVVLDLHSLTGASVSMKADPYSALFRARYDCVYGWERHTIPRMGEEQLLAHKLSLGERFFTAYSRYRVVKEDLPHLALGDLYQTVRVLYLDLQEVENELKRREGKHGSQTAKHTA
jgi:hypothetical protein